MSIGKVTTWFMTTEELAAYVKKHPIVPTEKPKDIKFDVDSIDYQKANERKIQAIKEKGTVMDAVDKGKLHKLFMDGVSLPEIARVLNVSYANLNNYISKQRKIDPKKWPYLKKIRPIGQDESKG